MLRLKTGKMLKPSIFIKAPKPAIGRAPKTLTEDCMITLEREITVF